MNAIRRTLTIACVFALLAPLAGCVKIYQDDIDPETSASQTSTDTPEASTEDDSDGEATVPADSEGVAPGTVGAPATLGSWSVTVVEAELDPRNSNGLIAEDGERLLKIETELTNEGTKPMRVSAEDWMLVDSKDAAYEVLPAESPDSRGERNIPQDKTAEVTVYFAVPDSSNGFILRFEPTEGGPGTLAVPVP